MKRNKQPIKVEFLGIELPPIYKDQIRKYKKLFTKDVEIVYNKLNERDKRGFLLGFFGKQLDKK